MGWRRHQRNRHRSRCESPTGSHPRIRWSRPTIGRRRQYLNRLMRCRPNRRRRHSGVDGDGAGRPARRFKRRRAVLTAGYSSWKERSGLPPGGSNVAVRSSTAGWWPSRSSTSARADHCAPGARVPWRRHQQATLGRAAQRSRLECLTPAATRCTVVLVLNTTLTRPLAFVEHPGRRRPSVPDATAMSKTVGVC